MTQFPRLFQPGKIGTMEVPNRIVMPPMGTMNADHEGYIAQRTIDYYEARAAGGVGLIIPQATYVIKEGFAPFRLGLFDDKFIPSLSALPKAVHKHGGKIAIQLQNNGKALLKEKLDGSPEEAARLDAVGPSAVPWCWNFATPRAMTKEDIQSYVTRFAEGVRRARDAGFDAVEFHGGHGYLISSFFSPFTNKRTDEYGGSVENRARFACEIIAAARKKIGPDFPLILRVSGTDFLKGGITIEDTVKAAPLWVKAGADALHISASAQETTEWQFMSYLFPDGAIVYLAEAVKKVVKVPVIAVGKIGDPALAEKILAEGKADFIAMGRALIADPELPNKAKEGRVDEIARCIYCNNCMSRSHKEKHDFGGLFCTVNPGLFREKSFGIKPAPTKKKVMVVGGGLAGMEAARVLAERGHSVSLYEKSDRLGGQWNIAVLEESKEIYTNLTERLERGLKAAKVKVSLNTEVTTEQIKKAKPDAVVLATGAVPKYLNCPGANGKNVVQAVDVITGKAKVGKRVVVVGGRLMGMEVAVALSKKGKKVSLITLKKLGQNGRPPQIEIYRTLRNRMIENGVMFFTDTPLYQVLDDGVYVSHNNDLMFLPADTVVMAVGADPVNQLESELKGVVSEVYSVGDCVKPRDALDAIREGAEVGRRI